MKKVILYILIPLFPFIIMIIVNEYFRSKIIKSGSNNSGFMIINSNEVNPERCSWNCHNNTAYCKKHHVKFLKPYFASVDKIYFGIIHFFKSTGNYVMANIIFLVVLWPLILYYLLIKSINLQIKIKSMKEKCLNI